MRKIEGEQVLMRIFIGEADRWERRPLHTALIELFRQKGLAGATVLKGVAGFGPDSIIHEAGLDGVLPEVDRMMSGGLVTNGEGPRRAVRAGGAC